MNARPQRTQMIYDESGASSGAGVSEQERIGLGIVIVNAVSSYADDNPDIAAKNIQSFLDSVHPDFVYESYSQESGLVHNGKRIKEKFELEEIPENDIVLLGGELGREHLWAFSEILRQMRRGLRNPVIHIPLDCCYSHIHMSESLENWTAGKFGSADALVVRDYTNALRENAPGSYLVNVNGRIIASSKPAVLRFWNNWRELEVCLNGVRNDK